MTTHEHQPKGVVRPSQSGDKKLRKFRVKYVPMSIEGALNPALSLEEKGMMLMACAARFAHQMQGHPEIQQALVDMEINPSYLPASEAEIKDYLKLNADQWLRFKLIFPGFKQISQDIAGALTDGDDRRKEEQQQQFQLTQPIRRAKI